MKSDFNCFKNYTEPCLTKPGTVSLPEVLGTTGEKWFHGHREQSAAGRWKGNPRKSRQPSAAHMPVTLAGHFTALASFLGSWVEVPHSYENLRHVEEKQGFLIAWILETGNKTLCFP